MNSVTEELYPLQNGLKIADPSHSRIMWRLRELYPEKNRDYTWDELGTAYLVRDIYADQIRFCPQKRAWYIWDKRWEKQIDSGVISDMFQTLLNLLRLYAEDIGNDDYKKFVNSLRKTTTIHNVIELLKTMCRLYTTDMDTNPYLLNTPTGAIDLRTGEHLDDISQYNVTKITNTHPENAFSKHCDRWDQFIDEIMSHDQEKARFLQRALGYSILGVNRSECMFIAYGSTTRNGKGTLMESIKRQWVKTTSSPPPPR